MGESFSLPDGNVLLQWDDGFLPVLSEGGSRVARRRDEITRFCIHPLDVFSFLSFFLPSVVHDGVVVVLGAQVVALLLLEVIGLNWAGIKKKNNKSEKCFGLPSRKKPNKRKNVRRVALTPVHVVPEDLDVFVAVFARVLVVEAECVQQLVQDDAVFHAAGHPQGHDLRAAHHAHQGGAAGEDGGLAPSLQSLARILFLFFKRNAIIELDHLHVFTPAATLCFLLKHLASC